MGRSEPPFGPPIVVLYAISFSELFFPMGYDSILCGRSPTDRRSTCLFGDGRGMLNAEQRTDKQA